MIFNEISLTLLLFILQSVVADLNLIGVLGNLDVRPK